VSWDLGFRRILIAIDQQPSYISYPQSLGSAQDAFGIKPDLLWATSATVLTIAWSPLILAIPDGMGVLQQLMMGG